MPFASVYLSWMRADLSGKLLIALASDEETRYMFEQIKGEMVADCVLSAEPSGTGAIAFSSKGYLQFTVEVATRGAISGYPNASLSDIRIAMHIIRDLDLLETINVDLPPSIATRLADTKYRGWLDDIYGEGAAGLIPVVSINVGTIQGGSSANSHSVFSEASKIVARYPEAHIRLEGADAADISDSEHEMTPIFQHVVTDLGWPKPQMAPDTAISDLRYWRYRGIPTFWYGPDGEHVSAANESVKIEELLHLVRTYVVASAEYLKKS
ncbi:hypothetical protein P153DRAFT_398548 [Dothidotthia symphoricarpi CBS 119687]|uniref:Peptidase M20 dimerisation domain-containing protein n=1 Tax=Dothidotthia symphoricarpi CBS 119687 TaxID=1392245 RepID=A0A6A6A7Q6_9PLEO|nr:uncharacterized protein P153DRAFT_398548 [Dothidotthia symphoricarpi CBS 119687]KAF2127193.1 hypothetical protein P153DRAFT_398548 [Dothidotthia symphoricarpi CBS 119687]